MARKKIIPEEEVPETAVVDETEVTDTGEAVQSGPPPNADALGAGVEAPIARGTGRKTAKKAAGEESLPKVEKKLPQRKHLTLLMKTSREQTTPRSPRAARSPLRWRAC